MQEHTRTGLLLTEKTSRTSEKRIYIASCSFLFPSPSFTMASFALLLVVLLVLVISWLWDYVMLRLIWKPQIITNKLRKHGIPGPPYKFFKGCNEDIKRMKEKADGLVLDVHDHNYLPRVASHYLKWRDQYGKGLVFVEGIDWVRHRRVINPAFAMDKIKMMTKTMVACAQNMVKELEDQASKNKNGETQVELEEQFHELTADIISDTAFGSSYKLGIEDFHAQKELQEIVVETRLDVQIPGSNYLPTASNRRKWKLERKLRGTLVQIIQSRLGSEGSLYGNDLLGLMLEACIPTEQGGKQQQISLSMDEIIHECKTFFFAGHEITALLLTWTVFLLSVYPEWQERLRKEVLREFGKDDPSGHNLSKLKEMTMILLETLRLYSPAVFTQRKTTTDMAVGEIKIPKGFGIIIPFAIMHRDKKVWDDNADEFNPLRFQNGVTKAAKVPHALLSFTIGPRSCIGQDFAMMEAKSVMAVILQKFSFTLSPDYVHAPVDLLTLQPKFGLPVILRRLDVCS
ncbi:hypothetical protein PAHAL_9G452200 [Panicum hallii]|uniref:Cytochrome P450 n=1 Tax=Panicum hallii TaxID=206008 RepID=A0A2T8I4R1_9POAL|nr:cytochrome P450 709B2-like isoform X3 [Panicum hallii]PVH32654.1 hypothetical protein PAHAL_9G452200 [Panicum hallii]